MPKTKLTLEFFLPTTSMTRVQDALVAIVGVVESHKGNSPFVTIAGPFADNFEKAQDNGKEDNGSSGLGRAAVGRDGAGSAAAGGDAGGSAGDALDGAAAGGDEPKRKRGRPAGSTGKARSGKAERERDDAGSDDANGAEGTERAVALGTREGADEGAGEGEGGRGRADGSGDDQRGDREASRVEDGADEEATEWGDDDDWGEEVIAEENEEFHSKTPGDAWPDHLTPKDIDTAVLTSLLAAHYKATGGKDRGLTFDIITRVAGVRALKDIKPEFYTDVAKALLKDTARYTYGVKKAK